MKKPITEKVKISEGVACTYDSGILSCTKDSTTLTRKISIPLTKISIEGNEIVFHCDKGNKTNYKTILSYIAHIKNMLLGLKEKFVYQLEAVNVHFPMNLKVEGDHLVIANFLGEKVPRKAKILPNVEVKVSGQKITIESHDKEAAGQTAANFEKATKLRGRDRRIFQDGIFITEKPASQGGKENAN